MLLFTWGGLAIGSTWVDPQCIGHSNYCSYCSYRGKAKENTEKLREKKSLSGTGCQEKITDMLLLQRGPCRSTVGVRSASVWFSIL